MDRIRAEFSEGPDPASYSCLSVARRLGRTIILPDWDPDSIDPAEYVASYCFSGGATGNLADISWMVRKVA